MHRIRIGATLAFVGSIIAASFACYSYWYRMRKAISDRRLCHFICLANPKSVALHN